NAGDGPGELGGIEAQPLRGLVGLERFLHGLERLAPAAVLAYLHAIAGLHGVRRNVGGRAVDREVAVGDELPGLGSRCREAEPEDDVVQPGLEPLQEGLAGDAGGPFGLAVVVPELALEHAVDTAHLLLLAKLDAELTHLAATHAVLAGRGRPALERAFLRVAARALQEEFGALAAAEAADGAGVAGHRLRPSAAWAGGSRCAEP